MAKCILVIEDNMIIAMVTRKALVSAGYLVNDVLSNGTEAIELIKKKSPDLILMDIQLDDNEDGVETMIEIRKFCQAPVIYLTGNSEVRSREKAAITGFSGFLIKPVQPRELVELVQEVIGAA